MRAADAASHSDDGPRTHVDDAVEAIRLTLAGGLRGFQLFHVIGEHGVQAWSTEASREQLGFIPRYRTLGES